VAKDQWTDYCLVYCVSAQLSIACNYQTVNGETEADDRNLVLKSPFTHIYSKTMYKVAQRKESKLIKVAAPADGFCMRSLK
jgi:hypothetical protein